MSRLESTYSEQVDFVHIDWDDPDSREVIQYFGVLRRTTYILISPNGQVLRQWVGPISEEVVSAEIQKALESSQ